MSLFQGVLHDPNMNPPASADCFSGGGFALLKHLVNLVITNKSMREEVFGRP